MADRYAQSTAALEERTKARRQGASISSRSPRRDRQRLVAFQTHPGVLPGEDVEAFDPAGMQGPTPVQQPLDVWTQWEVTPSYGGRSGRRMSESARYNSEAQIMQVRFASGGRGRPNTYAYFCIDEETWENFMAGRWCDNTTATYCFVTNWSGERV